MFRTSSCQLLVPAHQRSTHAHGNLAAGKVWVIDSAAIKTAVAAACDVGCCSCSMPSPLPAHKLGTPLVLVLQVHWLVDTSRLLMTTLACQQVSHHDGACEQRGFGRARLTQVLADEVAARRVGHEMGDQGLLCGGRRQHKHELHTRAAAGHITRGLRCSRQVHWQEDTASAEAASHAEPTAAKAISWPLDRRLARKPRQ